MYRQRGGNTPAIIPRVPLWGEWHRHFSLCGDSFLAIELVASCDATVSFPCWEILSIHTNWIANIGVLCVLVEHLWSQWELITQSAQQIGPFLAFRLLVNEVSCQDACIRVWRCMECPTEVSCYLTSLLQATGLDRQCFFESIFNRISHIFSKELYQRVFPKQIHASFLTIAKTLINDCNQRCHIILHNTHNILRDTQLLEQLLKWTPRIGDSMISMPPHDCSIVTSLFLCIMPYLSSCQAYTRQHLQFPLLRYENLSTLQAHAEQPPSKEEREKIQKKKTSRSNKRCGPLLVHKTEWD